MEKYQNSGIMALSLTFIFALNTLPCFAEPPALIPRAILFGNPEKTSPKLSPDGNSLAYIAPDSKGVLNLWLKTLGKDDDKLLTADKKRGVRRFGWQPDGKHVLYMQDQDGDENWHIFQTDIASKATRDITPFMNVKADIVTIDSNFPNEMLLSMNLRDQKVFDVYHADLRSGALELICENPGDVEDWNCDNNLQVREATASTRDGGTEIRIRDKVSSPWKTYAKFGPDESTPGFAGFSADNKSMWMTSSLGADTNRLIKVDLATLKEEQVASDKDYDLSSVLVNPKTHELLAVAFEKNRTEWQPILNSIADDLEKLKKLNEGSMRIASQDASGQKYIVSYDSDDSPGSKFYTYDRRTKTSSYLFCSRPVLEKYKLAKMQAVDISARDGMKLHCYLSLPPGLAPKNLPLIVLVHGGPWGRVSWGFDGDSQWLANRGFAVMNVNFRGSTGFGKQYLNAGDKEWAGKMQTDLLDAKAWAIKQGYVDPKKTCIYGASYGGYATLVAAAFTPDEFVCGVDMVGPSNLVTLLSAIPPYWETMKAMFAKRIGDPQKDKEFLESRSPLFKAQQIKMPLLIAQGAKDPRVPQAESDQIVAVIRKNKRPVEYMVFPDEGHGMARPENQVKFHAKMESFLSKYMGSSLEPIAKSEESEDLMK